MISELNVVLVKTAYSGHIGQAARALGNMGGHRLILVEPQCEVDESSKQGAAGAQRWLKNLTCYRNWEEFYKREGSGLRVALTRRTGKRRQSQTLPQCLKEIKHQDQLEKGQPLYLIFGPEADGLSADDMAWVHKAASLPIAGSFKSVNLAHAVLLALFLARENFPREDDLPAEKEKPSSAAYFPDRTIRRWLTSMGFSIEKRRMSAYLTIRRLLLQNWPSDRELHVLEAILQQNIRKLEELKKLKGEPADSVSLLKEVANELSEVGIE